jgi:hypothetical protein
VGVEIIIGTYYIVSLEKGVERRSSLTLRGDFKGVSRERDVERGPYHWSKVPHEMGVER